MLRVEGLTVRYGDRVAVDGVDLAAADGEVLAVLGPSGCGKSSLLRAVAGLEPAAAGAVVIGGEDVTAVRPDRRRVGLMFQEHALFPHRTVAENVGFGPRMRGAGAAEVARRVAEALALVDLADAGGRPVTALSGGEQQRVALARAIAPSPRLLLLDEPLGSLDRVLRDRLLGELPRVFAELATTVLYVTHDQEEALRLADRVAVMDAGRIVAQGTPQEVWGAPASAFVARFLGLGPIVDGTVLVPGAVRLAHAGEEPSEHAAVLEARFAGDHTALRVRLASGHEVTLRTDPGAAVDGSAPVVVNPDGVRRVDGVAAAAWTREQRSPPSGRGAD